MFRVIFYQGGEKSGAWRTAAPVSSQKKAEALVAQIEAGGRPALWYAPGRLEACGMPEGAPHWWDFAALRHKAA